MLSLPYWADFTGVYNVYVGVLLFPRSSLVVTIIKGIISLLLVSVFDSLL